MVSLIWFANENVYCVSTKQHGDMKSGVFAFCILQARCALLVYCLARTRKSPTIPTDT